MFFSDSLYSNRNLAESAGFSGTGGNIVMIIISIFGIIINSIFSIDYLKNIISIKNKNNAGISAVEKILCMIAIVETFISVCWLINNIFYKDMVDDEHINHCSVIAYIEIFLNLFDWLILSTSLYQIKIILLNPQEILESGKRVLKYIIGCFVISLISLALSISGKIGGKSPMNTCFISFDEIRHIHNYVLFWLFFIIPLLCFGFGGYQVYLILKSNQYKNDKNNREFFIEYSYFVITYIISSILLIISYVINYIIEHTDPSGTNNGFYKFFMALVTFLTCSTPLIVGVIRYYRTGLLKRLCKLCQKKKRSGLIDENDEELIDVDDESVEGGRMFNMEKKMLEKLIVKYFTAVSFALGKSKYNESEGDGEEKTEKITEREYSNYKINRSEILKDLDLSLNEDIKVLGEANIDIEVTEYNSSLFKKLRQLEGLNEDKIIEMFQPKRGTNQLIHQIQDSFYINSSNKLLMLKKIKREQILFFQKNILPSLYEYFVNNPNSLICRIFGFFRIKIEEQDEIYMALIYNIHESIGGKWSNDEENIKKMKLTENEFKSNIVIGSSSNDLSIRNMSTNFAKMKLDNTTFYEPNKKTSFKLALSEYENDKLIKIVNNDTKFLMQKGINNYKYMIFEKKLKGIGNNPLNISIDEDNKDQKDDTNNVKIMNEIKKYIFNSNKPNAIYCICINGV